METEPLCASRWSLLTVCWNPVSPGQSCHPALIPNDSKSSGVSGMTPCQGEKGEICFPTL